MSDQTYEPPTDEQLANFACALIRRHEPGATPETVRWMLNSSEPLREAWLSIHREFQETALKMSAWKASTEKTS